MGIKDELDEEIKKTKSIVQRRLVYALVMLIFVYLLGIFTLQQLEGWTWEDSLYFTTATMTTVGYGDLVPQTYYGKLFTIPLMWIGITIGFYLIFSLQDYGRAGVEQRIENLLGRMESIRKLGRKKKK